MSPRPRKASPPSPPAAPPRIQVVSILDSENPVVAVMSPRSFGSLAEADDALARAFAVTPPPPGGAYDKTSFRVYWTDGRAHDSRVDVTTAAVRAARTNGGLLRAHLQQVAVWYRDHGATVAWWSDEQRADRVAWGAEMLRRLAREPPLVAAGTDRGDDGTDGPASGPRNAGPRRPRLTFRPVGATGDAYPPWVQATRGRSGVYIIRERQPDDDMPIVYVGQSSLDRLYETLTRHFQQWRRGKRFWRGYHSGHDPGLTYERAACDAAVILTAPAAALDLEAQLIARLRPRDNLIGQPPDLAEPLAAVPF